MATPLRIIQINNLYVVGRPRPKGLEVLGYRDTNGVVQPYYMKTRDIADAELAAIRMFPQTRLPLTIIPRLAEMTLTQLAK